MQRLTPYWLAALLTSSTMLANAGEDNVVTPQITDAEVINTEAVVSETEAVVPATPAQHAEHTIDAAITAADKARELGHEWRDTRKLIKRAQTAMAEGEFENALALAQQAKLQGEMAVQQALTQQDAGPRF